MNDKVLIDRNLLKEVIHELTFLTGLNATDKVMCDDEKTIELNVDELIGLDYTGLLKRLDECEKRRKMEFKKVKITDGKSKHFMLKEIPNMKFKSNNQFKDRDNQILWEIIYYLECQIIEEWSSTIDKDLQKLNEITNSKNIIELMKFTAGSKNRLKHFENKYGVKLLWKQENILYYEVEFAKSIETGHLTK